MGARISTARNGSDRERGKLSPIQNDKRALCSADRAHANFALIGNATPTSRY
jgi:hypothetical protein